MAHKSRVGRSTKYLVFAESIEKLWKLRNVDGLKSVESLISCGSHRGNFVSVLLLFCFRLLILDVVSQNPVYGVCTCKFHHFSNDLSSLLKRYCQPRRTEDSTVIEVIVMNSLWKQTEGKRVCREFDVCVLRALCTSAAKFVGGIRTTKNTPARSRWQQVLGVWTFTALKGD